MNPYGSIFPEVLDLEPLRKKHVPRYRRQERIQMDGNGAAAIASLQFWRAPLYAGFPITPSTKWLEMISTYINAGRFVVEENGRRVSAKRVKLLEAEHPVADYL